MPKKKKTTTNFEEWNELTLVEWGSEDGDDRRAWLEEELAEVRQQSDKLRRKRGRLSEA
jgi:hypothetical protein